MKLYFADVFQVSQDALDDYGAFNISLITDLPLFIDPFLLFHSYKKEYQQLHDHMISYLRFLKGKSERGGVSPGLLKSLYCFSEVRQNWLGFCETGNTGRGLGSKFATALDVNLVDVFRNFGEERITKGSHLEKLCLIESGVGRDMISDFSTNLIKHYLLEYTEAFAREHIDSSLTRRVSVGRSVFDHSLEGWMPRQYQLPYYEGDYVILTPKDILTKDETWINHKDMVDNFLEIPDAIDNVALRAQINNYFCSRIPDIAKPTKEDYAQAIKSTLRKYPEIIDFYIKQKESRGKEAIAISTAKVVDSLLLYVKQFGELAHLLSQTLFFKIPGTTREETKQKIEFFKDVVENKEGHRLFYAKGKPVGRERDVHILFRLTWHYTLSDVSREVDDGRGPSDFKISRGASDKTLVEFKLASNSQLKRNLLNQLDIYKKASDAEAGYKVIIYFTKDERARVERILGDLGMANDPNIYLIDARTDNKPTGSRA